VKGIVLSKDTVTAYLRGKTMYAKILGDPVLNYSKDGKEWKMDLIIDKDGVKALKGYGIGDRVKSKPDYADGQYFVSFKQRESRADGSPNEPIKVVDGQQKPWDQSKLIGNGSTVDVKFVVKDYGAGKKKGVYIRAVRVLDLVSFNRSEFADLDEGDEFFTEKPEKGTEDFNEDFGIQVDDLDDEIPL